MSHDSSNMKTFPSLAVASAVTGIGLCDGLSFSLMGEITSHILGYPVWTHEIPDAGRRAWLVLKRQFPLLPSRDDAASDWKAAAAAMTAAYGAEIEIRAGAGERKESPLDTLQKMIGDKPVVAVTL
jgi:hypothetical protein